MIRCEVVWVSWCDGCQTEERKPCVQVWPIEWRDFVAAGMPLFEGWKQLQVERGAGVETYLFCPACAPWPFLGTVTQTDEGPRLGVAANATVTSEDPR